MNVQQAIDRFFDLVRKGRVYNARKDDFLPLKNEQDAGIIVSAASRAFRAAAGTSDLTRIDYRLYAATLPQHVAADARTDGILDVSNLEARCRRFVRTVDQKRVTRRYLANAVATDSWAELAAAIDAKGDGTETRRDRKYTDLLTLAGALATQGIHTPVHMPDKNRAQRLLATLGYGARKTKRMLRAYRLARRWAIELGATKAYPDIDRCPVLSERGLRSLPDIVELLEEVGCTDPVAQLDQERAIELLAPVWYRGMTKALATSGASPRKRMRIIQASSRILAELTRSGQGDLRTAHPTPLLVKKVDTGEEVETDSEDEALWAEGLHVEDDGAEPEEEGRTRKIILLEDLLGRQAHLSAERSYLYDLDDPDAVFWTHTIQNDVRLIGELGLVAGQGSALFRRSPTTASNAAAALKEFRGRMLAENKERRLAGHKAKEGILALVTFPVMLFLGLPALRKLAYLRRGEVDVVRTRVAELEDHSSTGGSMLGRDTEELRKARAVLERCKSDYYEALRDYVLFVMLYLDGLRIANYGHARLGPATRDTGLFETVAYTGEVVKSYSHVFPELDERGHLVNVRTGFFGEDHPDVKLKIPRTPGSKEWSTRLHWLRHGLVDLELYRAYLVEARPENLYRQGLISDPADYSLEDDIANRHFALLVSPEGSDHAYDAVTGAYSLGTLASIFGRRLHWICTVVLGHELKPYGSPELQRQYPEVFAPHVSRLKAGSFLNGILDRMNDARVFLADTRKVIENQYSVVEASLMTKKGWEHPEYFNDLFRRVWDERELIDWDHFDPLEGVPAKDRPPGLDAVE